LRRMNIEPGDKIAGYPARLIRDGLRKSGDNFYAERFSEQAKIELAEARKLLRKLEKLGYVEREPDRDGDFTWGTTLKGGQLINASAMKPITRASAEKAVAAFLGHCDELDVDPYWLYRVKRVRVFGSYITDKERLGDVDLVVELERKNPETFIEDSKRRSHEAQMKGRVFRNIVDEICWSEIEAKQFLRSGSKYLRMHELSDGLFKKKKIAMKTLYPR
jgi:hypothetical protein